MDDRTGEGGAEAGDGAYRIVRAAAQRRTAWKNGGGETSEVAVHPPGSGLDAFDWRISAAVVAQDGPFSQFAGMDRTLCVLEGEALALDFAGGATVTLTPQSPPFSFAGDVPVFARLGAGAITDLNVMTRRGAWRHRVGRHGAETEICPAAGDCMVAVLAWQGGLDIDVQGARETLGAGDALFLAAPFAAVRVVAPRSGFYVVELARVDTGRTASF
jgi:hypothetical protein